MSKRKKITTEIPVPEVGKKYHFFDDGKCGPSRHFIATVNEVIGANEAKHRYFESFHRGTLRPLYDIWQEEIKISDHLFAKETDYFVACNIPKYDKNLIWFVRTKDGGWFSIDVQTSWQSGRLDVTGEIYDNIRESFDNDTWYGRYDELSETEKID